MQSIHIEAPVETVFDFFYDPRKSADLAPMPMQLREVRMTEEGTGSYMSWRARMAGVPMQGFDVYTDVQRNRHITDTSSSSLVGTWEMDFEPEGTGTKVTMQHRSRSVWGMPPLRNLGDLLAGRLNESFMQRAKERLEADGDRAGGEAVR